MRIRSRFRPIPAGRGKGCCPLSQSHAEGAGVTSKWLARRLTAACGRDALLECWLARISLENATEPTTTALKRRCRSRGAAALRLRRDGRFAPDLPLGPTPREGDGAARSAQGSPSPAWRAKLFGFAQITSTRQSLYAVARHDGGEGGEPSSRWSSSSKTRFARHANDVARSSRPSDRHYSHVRADEDQVTGPGESRSSAGQRRDRLAVKTKRLNG